LLDRRSRINIHGADWLALFRRLRVDRFDARNSNCTAVPDTPPGVRCVAEVAKAAIAYRRAPFR